ncbi:MAG: sugar transferase, partial [Acidimicrobiia bacterium]
MPLSVVFISPLGAFLVTTAAEPNSTDDSPIARPHGGVDTLDGRHRHENVTTLHGDTAPRADDFDLVEPGGAAASAQTRRRRTEWARTTAVAGLAIFDAGVLLVAMALAFRFRTLLPGENPVPTRVQHSALALTSLPIWIAFLSYYGLYARRLTSTRLDDFRRIAHAVGASIMATMAVAFVAQWNVARGWLLITFVLALFTLTLEREIARRAIQRARRRGRLLNSVVIVGANHEARSLLDQFVRHPELGYQVVGMVETAPEPEVLLRPQGSMQDTIAAVMDVVERTAAARVLVARTAVNAETTNRLTRALTHTGIPVEITSSLDDIDAERLTVRALGRFASVSVEPVRRGGWRAAAKRTFDIFGSLVVLVAVAPLLLVIAIAVKCTSRGPLLFSHDRTGLNGRRFKLYKIRSMVPGAEHMVIDLR